MARPSSIARLPKELSDLCHRLIREGKTIHEITDKLNELDAEVSKSAVGRYVKSAREQMQRYREAQEVAGQWVAQLGENPGGDVGALLAEMLKTVAFQALGSMGEAQAGEDGKGAPKPMDIMLLAKAIRDLEATSKANIERREKIERAAIERAAKKAGEVGERVGLSQATIDEIQKELRLL
jgi:response regulator RpfG family c-di-GMP phosphodiesterase